MNPTEEIVRGFDAYQLDVDLTSILQQADRRRKRRNTTVGALAGSLLVAVIAIGVMAPSPEAQALWSPIPVTPDVDLTADAADLCASGRPAELPPLPPLRLIDQRGDAALAVFTERGSDANGPTASISTCTLIRSDGQWTAPDELPFQAHTMAGTVDMQEAAKVVIDQNDGVRVEGTFEDGFFHFWWPETESFPGGTMLVLDDAGNVISSREIPTRPQD